MIQRVTPIVFAVLLIGCSQATPMPTITPHPSQTTKPSVTSTTTASPVPPTFTIQPTQPLPTASQGLMICSPLEGISLADLPATIYNPYAPPRLGSDDPHQGVDFADIDPTYQIALEGRQVNAVVDGVVAGVIVDRFPYGNAILVETPMDQLTNEWLEALQIPTPAVPHQGHPSLTCPETLINLNINSEARSIYLIYAHLKEPVTLETGNAVKCGQSVGAIGNSGNSLNPHIHLEMRVGPAGTRFESMAHYTGNATPAEMANYCLWRVSDTFQLLDPMALLSQTQ